jgi:hypothetical protein
MEQIVGVSDSSLARWARRDRDLYSHKRRAEERTAMAMSEIQHHGVWVRPGAGGCLCGMVRRGNTMVGGDCRSLGCDPCCPACGDEDGSECPNSVECAGTGQGKGQSEPVEREWSSYEMYGATDGAW